MNLSKLLMAVWIFLLSTVSVYASDKPNIVFILADDLGYGDLQAYNPQRCKIATPNMDRLAAQGMMFTDAHSSSSVCTPTRYSILTGRYNWRTTRQQGVLNGFGRPMIPTDRLTVAGFLQQQGYNTACVGKWHLGMNLPSSDGKGFKGHNARNIDWTKSITGGPTAVGFDYYYGVTASLDMPPYIYVQNDRFVGEATETKAFRTPRRPGPAHPDFEAVDVLPEIGRKSVEYIQQQDASKPFFLYVPLTSPHTPIVPSPQWLGKSGVGEYGDFTMQTDAVVGQIVDAIDQGGFAEHTIVIVTSDNGCSKSAGIDGLQKQDHYPSAHLRGSKADLWDGGHRIPFIVRWPFLVEAGTNCDGTILQLDLMATCADLLGATYPASAGEDSVSFLPALKGKPIASKRTGVVHHSVSGHFAYRQGKWKLLLAKGSGGWTVPNEKQLRESNIRGQLYDMESDSGEQNNLFQSKPEIVDELLTALKRDIQRGRSTSGPDQANDLAFEKIKLWKSERN